MSLQEEFETLREARLVEMDNEAQNVYNQLNAITTQHYDMTVEQFMALYQHIQEMKKLGA
jgi:hypothetical protein